MNPQNNTETADNAVNPPKTAPETPKLGKWTNLKIVLIFLAIGIGSLLVVYWVRGSLRPVFIGCALAVLMKSTCNVLRAKLEASIAKKFEPTDRIKGTVHILSIVLAYIIWLSLIFAFCYLVIPKFAEALITIAKSLPAAVTTAMEWVKNFINEQPLLSEYSETIIDTTVNKVAEWAKNDLPALLGSLANNLISSIGGTVSVIFDTVVGLIISFYLLSGRQKLAAQLKVVLYAMLGERFARPVIEELKFANKMFSSYFTGSLIDSALVGVIAYVGTLIFGIPYGILVAVIVGITNVIPFFGPYIGMIPSAVIIMTVDPLKAVIFVIMMIVIQQIDGNVICPKIVGSTTGLSSFWVLFAILLFGGLFGFIGMIIGVPVFAVFYDVIEKTVRYCLDIRGLGLVMEEYDRCHPKETEKPKKPSLTSKLLDKLKTKLTSIRSKPGNNTKKK